MADSASYSLAKKGRLLKDTAGRGLTRRLWPREIKEEEGQLEDKGENHVRMSQARTGRLLAIYMEYRESRLADGRLIWNLAG